MLGSATFTIVMSTSSMNVVAQTATSVQRFPRAAASTRRIVVSGRAPKRPLPEISGPVTTEGGWRTGLEPATTGTTTRGSTN